MTASQVDRLRLERDQAQTAVDVDRRSARFGRTLSLSGLASLLLGIASGIVDGLLVPTDTLMPLPPVTGIVGGLVCVIGTFIYAAFTLDPAPVRHVHALRDAEIALSNALEE